MTRIEDSISRVRNTIKAVKEDAFLTDRYLYALLLKYGQLYVKRMDDANKIARYSSLFVKLPCVEMIEVDRIEACCGDIKSNCTFMRTKDKLPDSFEGSYGPLFRTVSSIDGSIPMIRTTPVIFTQMSNTTNFKYNPYKYYWFLDGYLYAPNIEWEAIQLEMMPSDDISAYTCCEDPCAIIQSMPTHIPDYLFAQIENDVRTELLNTLQIPKEAIQDNQSNLRD